MNLNLDRPAELGETTDPRRVVPGNPDALRATASAWQRDADAWDHLGRRLRTLDLGWTGQAADAHAEHATGQTRRHFAASDALRAAAQALTEQAHAVEYAQQQARDAIAAWDQADDHAARRDNRTEDNDTRSLREQAQDSLHRGRAHLTDTSHRTTTAISRHRGHLPNPVRLLTDPTPATTPAAAIPLLPPPTASLATPAALTGGADLAPVSAIHAALNPDLYPTAAHDTAARDKDSHERSGAQHETQRTITVEPGDNLSGIAHTHLGDAARWPEIFDLNEGVVQRSDGQALEYPWLIRPGWELDLPDFTRDAPPAEDFPRERTHDEPPVTHGAPGEDNTAGQPTRSAPVHPDEDAGGMDLGTGVFLAAGVIAAVSAAVLLARRRRDYSHVPGRDTTPDHPPLPPVVRQMHYSHQCHHPTPHLAAPPAPQPAAPPRPADRQRVSVPVGDRNNSPVRVDLDAGPALAINGPRSADVARALLTALLTHRPTRPGDSPARVLLTAADAAYLLGPRPDRLPPALRIVGDLDAALDELHTQTRPSHRPQPVTLIARPPQPGSRTEQRLRALLASRQTNVCVVILGRWPTRLTIVTDANGLIQTTGPGLPAGLQGVRLYTLPAAQARDLIVTLAPPPPAPLPEDHYPDPTTYLTVEPADTPPHPSDNSPVHPADDDDTIEAAIGTEAGLSKPLTTILVPPDSTEPERTEPSRAPDLVRQPTRREPTHPTPTAEPAGAALAVDVFGPLRLRWTLTGTDTARELVCDLSEQRRELLTYLAIHPDGVRRDTIIEAMWGEHPPSRPANALRTGIMRLRQTLTAATGTTGVELIHTTIDGRYQLNPTLVTVDYWAFLSAMADKRGAVTDTQRVAACRQALAAYRGPLALDLTAEWADPPREHAKRQALDAADTLARALATNDPDQALGILEHATTTIDTRAEHLYRAIIGLHRRHGRHAAAARTLATLTDHLAEIDAKPHASTIALATTRADAAAQHAEADAP